MSTLYTPHPDGSSLNSDTWIQVTLASLELDFIVEGRQSWQLPARFKNTPYIYD